MADAHAVYDHLFKNGGVIEVGCWAHGRRYFFKSLSSDPERARTALALIKALFQLERAHGDCAAGDAAEDASAGGQADRRALLRLVRGGASAPCSTRRRSRKAIGYALNQRTALLALSRGRTAAASITTSARDSCAARLLEERTGCSSAVTRAAETNATFVSLLASCQLHDIEPLGYLRDLFCLLPSWPKSRALELAPAYWQKTLADGNTQRLLTANVYRQASLGTLVPHQVTL